MELWLGALGLFIFTMRLGIRRSSRPSKIGPTFWPFVSILIPARNEAGNLKKLLPSLKSLDYPRFEILIIDDSSTDDTAAVAKSFDVTVINIPPRPGCWSGKNWACDQGAKKALGDLFLFTDADTIHQPDSLKKSVRALLGEKAGLLSAPPYHLCFLWWEKLLGLFHLLPLLLTAYRQTPRPERLFAIGQYLLFTKDTYEQIEGHQGISASLTDDLDLARQVMKSGHRYFVYPECDLFQVRMYESFETFCLGWKRLFRLGMSRTHIFSVVELLLVFHLFLGLSSALSAPFSRSFAVASLLLILAILFLQERQKQSGSFSFWGALFFPFSILLFTFLSIWAILDLSLKKPIQWRSRDYPQREEKESKYA